MEGTWKSGKGVVGVRSISRLGAGPGGDTVDVVVVVDVDGPGKGVGCRGRCVGRDCARDG